METKVDLIIDELKKARDAQEPEKSCQFAASFERLGDYFVEQLDTQTDNLLTRHRTALKAISIYNLALASAQVVNDDHRSKELLEKIQAVENVIIEGSAGKTTHQSLAFYEQEIDYWKKRLQNIRTEAKVALGKVELNSPEIQTIYKTIARNLKLMIKDMIESCFKILPLPNDCVYSIITLGSLAREEATPYSDFEWAILIENPDHKEYFRRLSELLWIKVINLGETTARMMDIEELNWFDESESPCKKGFSFDGQMLSGCHTPLGNRHHTANKIKMIGQSTLLSDEEKTIQIQKINEGEYELIGTPEELAQYQTEHWETKRGFCTVLSTVALIIASNKNHLVQEYKDTMAKIWSSNVESGNNHTMIQKRSLTYLTESVERFQFRGGHFGKETHYFDAKYHLYRLPNMLIDHLSSYFNVTSKNMWGRIDDIFGGERIAPFPEKAKALKEMISQILGLRLRAYCNKGYRDDHIVMFDPQKPKKNIAAIEKYLGVDETLLMKIYSELFELQWRMESFLGQRGATAALEAEYGDMSDVVRGEMYHLLLNYIKAANAFERAIDKMKTSRGPEHLSVAVTLNKLGIVYQEQACYSEAIAAFQEAKRIIIAHQGLEHVSVAQTLNNLGAVYDLQTRYLDAMAAYEESKRIMIAIQGPEHPSVADTLNNLGIVYRAQAQFTEAIAAYQQAKRIMIVFHGFEHFSIADTLNNLGVVYQEQTQYTEAIVVYKEAKRIRTANYGPEHLFVAESLNNLGNVYQLQGRYRAAIAAYVKSKRIKTATYGPMHPKVGNTLCNIGQVLIEQGKYKEARASFQTALDVYERTQPSNQKKAKSLLNVSYIREGNFFMLQEEMNIMDARRCYEDAYLFRDPLDPILHQELANMFYSKNQMTGVLEHYRILIRLTPDNASAHHDLACLIHARACIEHSKGNVEQALNYINEAEGYFEQAIHLTSQDGVCTDTGVSTEYAHFLWKNRTFCESKKIVALLQQAISLQQMEKGLSYGQMERSTLDQYLQSLFDQENKLVFNAYYLAHYLLIQVYCETDQLESARDLFRDFLAQVKEDEATYSAKKATLITQFRVLIESNPGKTKLYEEKLQQKTLANETKQGLHARLVEGSQAAIKRCILAQQKQSTQFDHSPKFSPRLLRDSPILAEEVPGKKEDQEMIIRLKTKSLMLNQ